MLQRALLAAAAMCLPAATWVTMVPMHPRELGAPGGNTVVLHRLLWRTSLVLEREGSRWRAVVAKHLGKKIWKLLLVRKASVSVCIRQKV